MDVTCRRCGQNIPHFARLCEHCGHAIVDSRFTVLGLSLDIPPREHVQGGLDFSHDDDVESPEVGEVEAVPAPQASPITVRPSAEPSAPVPVRSTQRMILFVTLACVVSGAITFGALMARTEPAAALSAAAPAAATAPKPPEEFTEAARWTSANTGVWTHGHKNSVAFEVPSANTVGVWMRTVRPTLVVRCASGEIEAFVFTASPARIEPQTDDHSVQLSFDGNQQLTERWKDSEEHDALFAPDSAAFVQKILAARAFRFGYTPHNATPVAAWFNVAGLRQHLEGAVRQCGGVK